MTRPLAAACFFALPSMPRSSRALLAAFAAAGLLLLAGCGDADAPDPADAPRTNLDARTGEARRVAPPDSARPVPALALPTLAGDTLRLAERPGEVLLVNFWATWCAPCLKEIPDFVALQRDLGPAGLTVVGIALDQDGAAPVRTFAREHGITYPLVADSTGRFADAFGRVRGLPTTFVVGPDGRIRRTVLGLFPTDALRPALAAMLRDDGA